MKKILILAAVIIILLFSVFLLKGQIIRSSVAATASAVIGAPVKINDFSLNLASGTVSIAGLRVYNPQGFPEGMLINMPKASVSCDLAALLKKEIHLKSVEIDIKEIGVTRNKDGQLNVDALKVAEKKEEKTPDKREEKPAKALPMRIDTLKLNVGQVIYRDYSKGEPPKISSYDAGIKNKTYTNITSAEQLVALILTESLKNTAIGSAKIYAASAILSTGFLPAGAALTLFGKDSSKQDFDVSFEKTYNASLKSMRGLATIKKEDKEGGIITGTTTDKITITAKIDKLSQKSTRVTISAKKFLLPKPEIAKSVLSQISEELR
ncbi:MAG TPA: hypothetical protein DCL35_00255 [Candidatus Omnitrophica bacterium]|nr:hypothetical protein [Candidatus Omnitrophota bacterium]